MMVENTTPPSEAVQEKIKDKWEALKLFPGQINELVAVLQLNADAFHIPSFALATDIIVNALEYAARAAKQYLWLLKREGEVFAAQFAEIESPTLAEIKQAQHYAQQQANDPSFPVENIGELFDLAIELQAKYDASAEQVRVMRAQIIENREHQRLVARAIRAYRAEQKAAKGEGQ